MMNRSKAALVAIALSALAGCGGAGDKAKSEPPKVDYTSAQSIASALDRSGFACTNWTPNPAAIGPRDSGTCAHGATTVNVSTFSSKDQMTFLLESARRTFGAKASGPSVQGDTWLVALDDKTQAPEVKRILGGTIR
jgi:hypothetical protein